MADAPTDFIWVQKGRIASSGFPASRRQVAWLCRNGVNRILTLTENPLPPDWIEGLPLETEHVPMIDHEPPDMSSLERAAAYVRREVYGGNVVLVHCLAGNGRTMCVLAAYMIKNGVGAKEAIRTLRTIRPGAVESGQEKAVLEYESVSRLGMLHS